MYEYNEQLLLLKISADALAPLGVIIRDNFIKYL